MLDTSRSRASRRKFRGAVVGLAATGLVAGIAAASGSAALARPDHSATRGAQGASQGAQHSALAAATRHGKFLGVVPTQRGRAAYAAALANGTPPLTYHNGPVQHSSTVYAIFWQPPGYYYSPSYRSTISQYFNDLSAASFRTSNVYASDTQYYDKTGPGSTKNFISDSVTFAGSALVKDAVPASKCANYTMGDGTLSKACLTDAQLMTEIKNVIAANHWPTDLGHEYFLFTPKQLGDCFDTSFKDGCYDPSTVSSHAYCAYHSWIGVSTLYAVLPWADLTGGCQYSTRHSPSPNDDGADIAINLISHEQNETMTDPLGTAWYDSGFSENGDECAWLSLATKYNGIGDYSQTINGDEYLMQYEWSDRAKKCVATNTYPQPTGSFGFTPNGSLDESFSATASDSDDSTFTYLWNFGDGTATVLGSSASPTHLYAQAGTYTVTLVIFDPHGDQIRITHSVPVS